MKGRTLLVLAGVWALAVFALTCGDGLTWGELRDGTWFGKVLTQGRGHSAKPPRGPSWSVVNIVAEIETIRDPLHIIPEIRPGDRMTGTYVFDREAPDGAAGPEGGSYRLNQAPSGVVLRIGKILFQSDPQNVDIEIEVGNRRFGDLFSFVSHNNVCRSKPGGPNLLSQPLRISWCVHDFTGEALASDEIPSGPLNLADWQSPVGLRIEGAGANSGADDSFLIVAKVVSTQAAAP